MHPKHLVVVATLVACGDPDETIQVETGELIGRVEISAEVPAGDCLVVLEGSPLGARCDGAGAFDIIGVLPGRWDLRVVADASTALPSRRVAAAANPGFVTDLGPIRLALPGAIGGRVVGVTEGVIVVPAFGIVTAPNDNGGYLLEGVPPGVHEVVLISGTQSVSRNGITVLPGKPTIAIDLDGGLGVEVATEVSGTALRANRGSGGHGGLTVELIDAATGVVAISTETVADGGFTLPTGPGIFAVRARDGDSPITAVIPSVVPHGNLPLVLPSPLVVFPLGDLDRDGLDDGTDPDIDNDGVENSIDAFPYDPAESLDLDGDGLGDRADIATMGAAIDTQNPTPDADGDGLFNFEDICKFVADPAQTDSDGDGIGNACDNCPAIANFDQADSVGNGVGNACRSCNGNEACPLGQTCQQGACVECTSSAQCNGEVCVDGGCEPCSGSVACESGLCNPQVGVCQECLVNLDCGAGAGCVAGRCFAGCDGDGDCAGSFCVGHVCVACRDNGDCPSNEYCDAGLCQPQCSVNANCSGGRICDLDTRTCELPCGAGCPTGQTCTPGNICEATCDLSFPCPGGQVCTAGVCGPACVTEAQCGALETCQLGECVPSGACNLDTDCSPSEMCGQFNTCIARPTSFDPAAGAFTCSGACDCKLGELCSAGHCLPDTVPTRFVAASSNGNGLSAGSPTSSLTTAFTNLVAGDLIAVRAGQTITTTTTPPTIAASNVRVQGGYTVCSATRWVRDPTQFSRLQTTQANTTILSLGQNFAVPTSNLVIKNLELVGDNSAGALEAEFTPNLRIENVRLDVSLSNPALGIHVRSSTGVVLDGIEVLPANVFVPLVPIRVESSSGTIRNLHFQQITGAVNVTGLHVLAPIGPISISNVTHELWSYFNQSQLLHVQSSTLAPVSITDSQFVPAVSVGGGGFAHIHVEDSAAVSIADCSLDSTGFLDPEAANSSRFSPVWFENSAGSIDRFTVDLPAITSNFTVTGFYVLGPRGDVTIRDSVVSGRGGAITQLMAIEDVVDSTTVVERCDFSSIQSGTTRTTGLFADNSTFVVRESRFDVPGTSQTVLGFDVITGARGRIEQSRFLSHGTPTVTLTSVGGRLAGDSTLELYNSWLVANGPASQFSAGLWLDSDFNLRAVGNTIEGAGTAGQPGESIGVRCEASSGQGQTLWSSNIIDGGLAANHFMVRDTTVSSCSNPASWDHAYFAFRGAGVRNATANEVADNIATGSATCQIRDATTCFATNDPATGFTLANGSLCANTGAQGTRLDGSTILLDLLGGARVKGGTADIGAEEHQ